ncbi:2OG-Fe(II) oxygenase [Stenotrophomonas maltophilia]|uniref:2OG-Fe(II) oxygenase n=1 Tax=Stenotrophomonas maltophilia TaxID=40324 RepID=UPI001980D04C|nr:2OG-Fe(II) oxygenase [Stenotrophomonas maltophilia]
MAALDVALENLDWARIGQQLDADGYAVLPGLLGTDAARHLAQTVNDSDLRKATLESIDLGRGDLRYFGTDLPPPLGPLRPALYRHLVAIANRWNEVLGVDGRYPAAFSAFRQHNRSAGQTRSQSHLSRLEVEGHVALHQRSEGEQVFPLQVVAVLSEPDVDFHGGEFVTTEQRPRMQSRPSVLPLKLGDIAIIATAERPFKGAKGYYRVNLKHAISRVRAGERIGLELLFHDAP